MLNLRRFAIGIACLAIVASAVLAFLPQSYVAQGGQRISCGITLAPRNPPPPLGTNDECDAAHAQRAAWIIALVVVSAAGAATSFITRPRGHSILT